MIFGLWKKTGDSLPDWVGLHSPIIPWLNPVCLLSVHWCHVGHLQVFRLRLQPVQVVKSGACHRRPCNSEVLPVLQCGSCSSPSSDRASPNSARATLRPRVQGHNAGTWRKERRIKATTVPQLDFDLLPTTARQRPSQSSARLPDFALSDLLIRAQQHHTWMGRTQLSVGAGKYLQVRIRYTNTKPLQKSRHGALQ